MTMPARTNSTRPGRTSGHLLPLLKDNLGLHVILGLGALCQLVVSTISGYHFILPVLLILGPLLHSTLIYLGLLENTFMRGTVQGRTTAKVPCDSDGATPNGAFGVVQIGFRANGVLGLLDPTAQIVSRNFSEMERWLYENAEEAGFLSSETYLGTRRASGNTILVTLYFRTWMDIHRFAHGMHMAGWQEYARQSHEAARPIEIWHESFMVAKSESIYVNTEPVGMGAAWQKSEDGEWVNGLRELSNKSSAKKRIGVV